MTCLPISAAVLCGFAAIFFVIGCSGNGTEEDGIKSAAWGYISFDNSFGEGEQWLGTAAAYIKSSDFNLDEVYEYKDCDSDADACETCLDAGAAGVGLAAVSLIIAVAAIAVNVVQACGKDNVLFRVIAIICTLITTIFAIAGAAAFDPCFRDVTDLLADAFGSATGTYGPGSILVFIGGFLTGIACLLNALTFCCCQKQEEQKNLTGAAM